MWLLAETQLPDVCQMGWYGAELGLVIVMTCRKCIANTAPPAPFRAATVRERSLPNCDSYSVKYAFSAKLARGRSGP